MRVVTHEREYTLYINERGEWTMHTWALFADEGDRWVTTDHNVSVNNPFVSEIYYNYWS